MHRWLAALLSPFTEDDARAWLGSETISQALVDAKTGGLFGQSDGARSTRATSRSDRGSSAALEKLGAPRAQLLADSANFARAASPRKRAPS
jgi:hypothetical protein